MVPKLALDAGAWANCKRDPKTFLEQVHGQCLHSAYNWEERIVEHKNGHKDVFFQGYARVLKDKTDSALEKSGNKGLFLEPLAADADKKPVRWEEMNDQEAPERYFARVAEMAAKERRPLAWRKGGGSCLGLRFNFPSELPASIATAATYSCHGVPRSWRKDDLESFLTSAGWSNVQILLEPRRRMGWVVKAIGPTNDGVQFVEGDNDLLVALSRRTGGGAPFKEKSSTWKPEAPTRTSFTNSFDRGLGFGPLKTSEPDDDDHDDNNMELDGEENKADAENNGGVAAEAGTTTADSSMGRRPAMAVASATSRPGTRTTRQQPRNRPKSPRRRWAIHGQLGRWNRNTPS